MHTPAVAVGPAVGIGIHVSVGVAVLVVVASVPGAGGDASTAVRIPIAELAANWPNEDVWLAVNPASEDGLGLPPDVVRALPVFAAQTSGDGHGGGDGTAGGGSAGPEPGAPPT
jgi:hypothetical protein